MKRTQVAVGLFVAIVSVVVTGWLTHEVLEQSLTLVVLSGSIMGADVLGLSRGRESLPAPR